MEIDQQGESFEIQDQVKLMNSEEQSDGNKNNQPTARSYECTFCKRGFTNAQALGGHMNIHRKEKAKLKQSTSTSSSMVVDTPKMIPTTPARLTWVIPPPTTAEDHGRDGDRENNPSFTLEETLIAEVRQLPLFVEKPSNMDQTLEIRQVPTSDLASDQKIGSSFRHDYVVSELDLELRLGPEPQNSTPTSSSDPTGSTKHFF